MHQNGLTENDNLRLHYRGNVKPAERLSKKSQLVDNGRKPLPTQHMPAPPEAPQLTSNKTPSFSTLKNIVMDADSLTAEQKLYLIDKISDLY